MPNRFARAYPPSDPIEVLNSLLTSHTDPTTLLICCSQAEFLTSVMTAVPSKDALPRLLRPTLEVLSIAPHVSVVYLPTVTHARAWLSVADKQHEAPLPPLLPYLHNFKHTSSNGRQPGAMGGSYRGRLVTWNLIRCHEDTSEWSVQGLSDTIAALVECSRRTGRHISLLEAEDISETPLGEEVEALHLSGNDDLEAVLMEGLELHGGSETLGNTVRQANNTGQEAEQGQEIYHRRLPMLNGSFRRTWFDNAQLWSGRTIEVGVVLKRWFTFSATGL